MSAENSIVHAVQARSKETVAEKIDALSAAIQELAGELIELRSALGVTQKPPIDGHHAPTKTGWLR